MFGEYSLFVILFLFAIIYSNPIENITDSNIDEFYEKTRNETILYIFYLNNCPYSQNSLEVIDNFEIGEGKDIKIAGVDCTNNLFSCMRFNVTKVPTIYKFKDDLLYEFTQHLTDASLIHFLNKDSTKDASIAYPPKKGHIDLFLHLLEESIVILTNYIQRMLNAGSSSGLKWERKHTIGFIVGVIVAFMIVQVWFLFNCCLRRKNKTKSE
jgi:hypothetical protein